MEKLVHELDVLSAVRDPWKLKHVLGAETCVCLAPKWLMRNLEGFTRNLMRI
jgi:hypothetical protein